MSMGDIKLGSFCAATFGLGVGFAHASLSAAEAMSISTNLGVGTTIAGLSLTCLAANSLKLRNDEYNIVASHFERLRKIQLGLLSGSFKKTQIQDEQVLPEDFAKYSANANRWLKVQSFKLWLLFGAISFSAGISARGFYEWNLLDDSNQYPAAETNTIQTNNSL